MHTRCLFHETDSQIRKLYSTETAFVKVTNGILVAVGEGKCFLPVDTVDHGILLSRLYHYGISRSALDFLKLYLTEVFLSLGQLTSDPAPLSCGVPQASVLGTVLFALYMLPLGCIIGHFKGISYHFYAYDIKLYWSFQPEEVNKLSIF